MKNNSLLKSLLIKFFVITGLTLLGAVLIFVLKPFHWDNADLLARVLNLLLITYSLSFLFYAWYYRLHRKFLFFFNHLSLKKRLLFIFIVTQILFIFSSFVLVQKGVTMSGDEPHYLVVSHSIAKDGDLNVFNQYARDQYREFMDVRLNHHARVGTGFKRWFSYGHLPGLSITLSPFFFFKIPNTLLYFLIRCYLGLFGSLLALLIYKFALKLWKNRSLSLFITIAYTLTAPVFFLSIHVFAELQASLIILTALYLILYAEKKTPFTILTAGFLLGIPVFWGLKYNIFAAVFTGLFFLHLLFREKKILNAFLLVIFPVFFQTLFFYFLYYAYGSFDPMAIYNGVMTEAQRLAYEANMQKIPLGKRFETLLGIFFDQRDGLLLYSPLYFFFFPGLVIAIRRIKKYWPHLILSSASFLYILFIGYSTVRAGYCPQARYLTPVAWTLMLFAIIYRNETTNRFFKKIFYYIPIYSIAVTLYQTFYPFTLYQDVTHTNLNRPGLIFQQWSNLYIDIPGFLPSFVKVPGNFEYLPNIVFLVLFIAFVVLALRPMKMYRLKWLGPVLFGVLAVIWVIFPRVPGYNPILVTKGDKPCKVYGISYYPTRAGEYKFPLNNGPGYVFTVSTLQPVPHFVLELENNDNVRYTVKGNSLQDSWKMDTVDPAATRKIIIETPSYKKTRNQYFYRIHIEINPAPPEKPTVFLQFYPEK